MSLWERIVAAFKREAADVKEGLEKAGGAISSELDRRQAELDAEPHERIDMLLEEQSRADEAFDELERRVRGAEDGEKEEGRD